MGQSFLFLCSNRLLPTTIQLRTLSISPKILLSKVLNCLWLPLMWIPFSQTCRLTKLLKYVLTNYLNLVKTVSGLNKQQVLEMLSLTTKENVILFDGKYYSQIDGVAMGSPLGPTFANIFLCHHETTWLKKLS